MLLGKQFLYDPVMLPMRKQKGVTNQCDKLTESNKENVFL